MKYSDTYQFEERFLKIVASDMDNKTIIPERLLEDILYEQDSVNRSCGNKGIDEAQAEWEYNNSRNNK